jgi:hypothetical protein
VVGGIAREDTPTRDAPPARFARWPSARQTRLDDVVVDAHEDHVFETHHGSLRGARA